MRHKTDQAGFTLFETMLYVALFGIIMSTISVFMMQIFHARIKAQIASNGFASIMLVENTIADAMRHARSIDVGNSVFGADPGQLTLEMIDPAKSPIVFRLDQDNGVVQISENNGPFTPITSTKFSVTDFQFTNLTGTEDAGVIKVNMTLSSENASNSPYYLYEKSFQSSFRIPPLP